LSVDVNELIKKINDFRNERNWRKYHNEKDLAISISLEANELLELFQWKSAEEGVADIERVKDELADVLIYCLQLADNLSLDVGEMIEAKLEKNAKKYPVR